MVEGAYVTVDMEPLVDAIGELERRGKNTRDVMRNIALMMVEEVDEMFETSGHGKWEPFSKNTRRKRGDMSSAKLLMDTGAMAASITPFYDAQTAEAFTNDPKAKYHVSKAKRSKIPLRDFFDIDLVSVQEEAAEMILKEIVG